MSLKITYADMKGITRSRRIQPTRSANVIWHDAVKLMDQVPKKPVRLTGTGLYRLAGEDDRQLRIEDFIKDEIPAEQDQLSIELERLHQRYGLDFVANLDKVFSGETLYRTVEYMRKHR